MSVTMSVGNNAQQLLSHWITNENIAVVNWAFINRLRDPYGEKATSA